MHAFHLCLIMLANVCVEIAVEVIWQMVCKSLRLMIMDKKMSASSKSIFDRVTHLLTV